MAEQEGQEPENKGIRPRERARGQNISFRLNILDKSQAIGVASKYQTLKFVQSY